MKRKVVETIMTFGLVLGLVAAAPGTAFAEEENIRDEMSTGSIEFRIYGEFGNNELYNLDAAEELESSVLEGKNIYWLGSSVTYGAASQQISMAEYIAKRNRCTCVKNAVPGTTLFTEGKNADESYVSRMLDSEYGFDPEEKVDAFICQISTNDVKTENLENRGEMPTSFGNVDLEQLDLSKTLDSLLYVIEYVHQTWDCPIYFYSGAHFDDEGVRGNVDPNGTNYEKLIDEVKTIAEGYNELEGYTVKVIDMFNDEEFNNLVTDSDYKYLMGDAIHPRQVGYLVWWTPYFEEFLYGEFA